MIALPEAGLATLRTAPDSRPFLRFARCLPALGISQTATNANYYFGVAVATSRWLPRLLVVVANSITTSKS